MYPIEDQVCTWEQAKKLVVIGVVLDTFFVFQEDKVGDKPFLLPKSLAYAQLEDIPAPNVAELGVVLPKQLIHQDANNRWRLIGVAANIWNPYPSQPGFYGAETEAQARADALIWLIENDYVKAEDLKL